MMWRLCLFGASFGLTLSLMTAAAGCSECAGVGGPIELESGTYTSSTDPYGDLHSDGDRTLDADLEAGVVVLSFDLQGVAVEETWALGEVGLYF